MQDKETDIDGADRRVAEFAGNDLTEEDMTAIVAFLEGTGPDSSGRFLSEVLTFGLGALESQHTYIQWLFPLTEASAAAPGSPVLCEADTEAIQSSETARGNLLRAARRMEWFYDQTDHWLAAVDHNHLRITRIIKSLRLLIGDSAANSFRDTILLKANRRHATVNATTRRYWAQA